MGLDLPERAISFGGSFINYSIFKTKCLNKQINRRVDACEFRKDHFQQLKNKEIYQVFSNKV